ncbi:hypothetical protein [Acaryochloris sp. IP29b_bin.148]|uniref:hypothetical protein n=1 Tax=Acaryochloris sp. IP29b_bin.148 TaxID=2969218 RepID=UPI00260F316E|nr:hypothetical protein [Acaryochloris sp. IP29b_bin.148]
MNQKIKERYQTDFLVLLAEEYGYRRWFWFPSMGEKELEIWWEKLESVDPYFMTPEPLPGDLIQAEDNDEFELFFKLRDSGNYYTAHTHCDDDSVLIKPNETKIFHQGYKSA